MVIVTGAAGFIGSCLIKRLNEDNFNAIIAVDKFDNPEKNKNLVGLKIQEKIDRDLFLNWLSNNHETVEFLFHIGARTDTTEFNTQLLSNLNTAYTKAIWKACCQYQIPLVYASSATTYGLGEIGYDDNEATIPHLKPLNPYGDSKQALDVWVLAQKEKPFFWAGLKFFNVYGPNEYHKGRKASLVWQAYQQISQTGKMKLFRSHNPAYKDGEQLCDFVYVKDVVAVCLFLMHHRKDSGIYNMGSGHARTFNDLAKAVFNTLNMPVHIDYIDQAADSSEMYQNYMEAKMEKLKGIGYLGKFYSLEEGIIDYLSTFRQHS